MKFQVTKVMSDMHLLELLFATKKYIIFPSLSHVAKKTFLTGELSTISEVWVWVERSEISHLLSVSGHNLSPVTAGAEPITIYNFTSPGTTLPGQQAWQTSPDNQHFTGVLVANSSDSHSTH